MVEDTKSQVWWFVPVTPAQEAEAVDSCQFEASWGYLIGSGHPTRLQSQILFQQTRKVAGEMAQWLRELAGPLEGLGLTSNTYVVVYNPP